MAAKWTALLDPTPEEIRAASPRDLEESALELLTADPAHDDEPRPTLRGHGDYVFGIFLLAVAAAEENDVYYQQVGLVITRDELLTVCRTPPNGHPPYDLTRVREAVRDDDSAGMIAYRFVDDMAEQYLDLVDALDAEIDELEDLVEDQSANTTRQRISDLRHDMLHIRRTLAPMRDAVRRVVMNAVEVENGPEVFPQEVEVAFNAAYDKLLRALDGLELSRDLLASVRDYAQAKVANDQNEVMKRLTVVASLFLPPTFIVGLYGQNFRHIPELRWSFGYGYVWGVIIVMTLFQILWFRRNNWI